MRVPDFTPDELADLFQRATGTRTGRGAQLWAAETLDVTPRTVRRWMAGETRPTRAQVWRLRVAARTGELRRRYRLDREAGLGPLPALARAFRELDDDVEEEVVERCQEDVERALRDPFRFDERTDDFRRFRKRHGRRTPRRFR